MTICVVVHMCLRLCIHVCECEFVHLCVSVHAYVLLCDCMFNVYMAIQMSMHEQACCAHVYVCIIMHV